MTQVNTQAAEFKLITDKKDEPDYKAVSKFVGGMVEVEVKNRFTGEATTMPEFAVAVYDAIIGSEMFGDYDTVRKGLDWFKQHFAKQYMVVLD